MFPVVNNYQMSKYDQLKRAQNIPHKNEEFSRNAMEIFMAFYHHTRKWHTSLKIKKATVSTNPTGSYKTKNQYLYN